MQAADPGTGIARTLASVEMATRRLLVTAALLTDAQAAAPSRLPGWSRGHLLTHLARNADGCRNLLTWARTGTETPMYASEPARDAAIAAGAGRGAAELAADARDSATRFARDAARLPAAAWAAAVARRGEQFPARQILAMRWSEVEIHHVDLEAGYQPSDWPADFVAAALPRVARSFAGRPDMPPCLLVPDGWAVTFPAGPAGPGRLGGAVPQLTVHGPSGILLAWLTGRADGTGLRVTGGAAVPVPPPWR